MLKNRNIILASGAITLIVGTVASIYHKNGKLPAFKFYLGVGILFTSLSFMAEVSEEVANALALAVVTFILIGDDANSAVFSHFLSPGGTEFNTGKKANPGPKEGSREAQQVEPIDSHGGAVVTRRDAGDATVEPLGMVGLKPLIVPGMNPDGMFYVHSEGN